MSVHRFAIGSLLLSLILMPHMQAQEVEPTDEQVPLVTSERPMSFWMSKKLEYSKELLQGLTAGDFEAIENHAKQMRLLAGIEGFVRGGNPEYTAQLRTFNLATSELERQAQAENIEGATAAFNRLTTSCVACHQTLRKTGDEEASPKK
ncbi:MAG: hypothetical protein ACO1RT_18725 [Planctomycetaceae bacterium]